MLLEFSHPTDAERLSPKNRAFVDKARRALALVNFSFESDGYRYYAGCMVFADISGDGSGKLDFRVYRPGLVSQAFIGPEIPISEEMFEGEQLKSSHIKDIERAFKDFEEYWKNSV